MRRGLLDTPERGALEKAGEERRMPDERRWQAERTRVRQGYPRIRRPDGLHVSKSIIDEECVFGQVQEVPLADADVCNARAGRRTGVERAGLIEHRAGMTLGADAVRRAWSQRRFNEHQPAALLRLRFPWREDGCWSAVRKIFQFAG